jgi:DNA-binding MarR family transcriptional regulator
MKTTKAPEPTATGLPAQACTNFKLRQLLRSVSRLYDGQIAQAGLKGSQFSLLSHVLALGPIAPSELAGRMGMDASTLTRNLRPLIDKGWVLQGPGTDARSRLITISADGVTKHAQARRHWKRAQQLLADRLGDDELAALHRMIEHAQSRLQAVDADEPVGRTSKTGR